MGLDAGFYVVLAVLSVWLCLGPEWILQGGTVGPGNGVHVVDPLGDIAAEVEQALAVGPE